MSLGGEGFGCRGEAQIAEERSDEGRGSAIWARRPAANELGLGQCSRMSPDRSALSSFRAGSAVPLDGMSGKCDPEAWSEDMEFGNPSECIG
jgi:hypothetical protein